MNIHIRLLFWTNENTNVYIKPTEDLQSEKKSNELSKQPVISSSSSSFCFFFGYRKDRSFLGTRYLARGGSALDAINFAVGHNVSRLILACVGQRCHNGGDRSRFE